MTESFLHIEARDQSKIYRALAMHPYVLNYIYVV